MVEYDTIARVVSLSSNIETRKEEAGLIFPTFGNQEEATFTIDELPKHLTEKDILPGVTRFVVTGIDEIVNYGTGKTFASTLFLRSNFKSRIDVTDEMAAEIESTFIK